MEATTAAAVTTPTDKSAHQPHQRGALDRELFCPRLQRLLLGAASELGQRGNLAQVVASIERGGVGGGGEDPNLGMLRRLGATDTRGIDNRVSHLRELDRRWSGLEKKRQATGLALYLGTPRCHPTLREHFGEGQGGLAGVVLYRWQLKQAKSRTRDCVTLGAKLVAALDALRAELLPLEQELVEVTAALDGPDGSKQRRDGAERRQDTLELMVAPLRVEQARLCADLAELAAAGNEADDELGLVKLLRGGLSKETKGELTQAAESDVRGLHRAWYATATKAAKDWVEGTTA
jgi:hypothetical protein